MSEISRITGHNYRTIVKYLEKDDFNINISMKESERKGCPRNIDSVIPIIDKWLEEDKTASLKQGHTAKRIYNRLKEEYVYILDVGYKTITNYVSKKKKERNI